MENFEIVLLALCIFLAVVFIIVRTFVGGLPALMLKTLASFGFVASAVWGLVLSSASGYTKMAFGLIIIGLLLGMIGDILLDLKVIYDNDKFYLNAGMLSFGLGHIAYFGAFSILANLQGIKLLTPILIAIGIAIVLTIVIMLSSKLMKLEFGHALWQTVAYSFVLSFMAIYSLALALMGGSWLIFVGMLVFFLSDIVLSMQYFGGKLFSKPLIAVNHLLYYAAQIIIMSVIFVL